MMKTNVRLALHTLATLLLATAVACTRVEADDSDRRQDLPVTRWQGAEAFQMPPDDVLRARLSALQYQVTQHDATERPFSNTYWDHKEPGIYVDIVSGEPLFSSADQYDSGTGWPSFTRPLEVGLLVETTDRKLGYARTEVRSKHADSHLGHVFPDGPKPTGLRYCMNSAALHFIPVDELSARGYGDYVDRFEP